jgi:hypothetical protein
MNFVQSRAAFSPMKSPTTRLPIEPYGQRLAGLSAALSPAHVEQLHIAGDALHKSQPNCCKNIHQ